MAVAELRRIAALGLGAAMLPLRGVPWEYNSPNWTPLWEAAEETGLPLVLHQGSGHDMLFYRGPGAAVANLLATQSMAPRSAALLATSGTLERHPALQFVFVETNAAWMSWAMDTLDSYYDAFLANPGWVRPELAEKPSHYLRRQIHGTFQWDPTGLNNIGRTGVGPLLWGSDYPHSEGTYPNSRRWSRSSSARSPRRMPPPSSAAPPCGCSASTPPTSRPRCRRLRPDRPRSGQRYGRRQLLAAVEHGGGVLGEQRPGLDHDSDRGRPLRQVPRAGAVAGPDDVGRVPPAAAVQRRAARSALVPAVLRDRDGDLGQPDAAEAVAVLAAGDQSQPSSRMAIRGWTGGACPSATQRCTARRPASYTGRHVTGLVSHVPGLRGSGRRRVPWPVPVTSHTLRRSVSARSRPCVAVTSNSLFRPARGRRGRPGRRRSGMGVAPSSRRGARPSQTLSRKPSTTRCSGWTASA